MKNKLHIYYLLFIIYYLYNNKIYSQNYIPNSGFDIQLICPDNQAQVNGYLANWYDPTNASSDYFSKCNDSSGASQVHIPLNAITYQYSTSNNYVGFVSIYRGYTQGREYVQVKLNSTLLKNKYYKASILVNKSNNSFYSTPIQICLSSDSIYSPISYSVIDTTINSITLTSSLVTDTLNWMSFSWEFYTGDKDSIQYLTLGNFLRDEHTLIDSNIIDTLPYLARGTYLLVDSVSLIPWHGVGIDEITILENINIYPNPTNDFIYIDYDKNKKLFYTLYDISGKLIFDKKIISPSIDIRILDNGIYLLEIKDEEDNCIRKKVIKE